MCQNGITFEVPAEPGSGCGACWSWALPAGWRGWLRIPTNLVNCSRKEKPPLATWPVRNAPEDLHERLCRLAQRRSRSLSAEAITRLYQAVEAEENRQRPGQLVADIRRRRFSLAAGAPDSPELLRADRQR